MTTERSADPVLLPPPASHVRPGGDWLGTDLAELQERLGARIRERPVLAVFTAFGLGYLVTRLLSRGAK